MGADMPTKLCETFTRSQFGSRYYRLSLAIVYTLTLIPIPIILHLTSDGFEASVMGFLLHHLTWYVFLAGFMYKAVKHWKAKKQEAAHIFDFEKYSKSSGIPQNWITLIKYNGKHLDIRVIETLVEPGIFVALGLGLILLQQSVGYLFFFGGIAFSANRFLQYHEGDEMVLDVIDQMIIMEKYSDAFVEQMEPKKTKGFQFRGGRPHAKGNRQKVADGIFNEDQENGDNVYAV